jgi:hypothetical protein
MVFNAKARPRACAQGSSNCGRGAGEPFPHSVWFIKTTIVNATSYQQIRSQAADRELPIDRFAEPSRLALKQVPMRKKTRVSQAAKLRRLEEKKQCSILKKERSKRALVED